MNIQMTRRNILVSLLAVPVAATLPIKKSDPVVESLLAHLDPNRPVITLHLMSSENEETRYPNYSPVDISHLYTVRDTADDIGVPLLLGSNVEEIRFPAGGAGSSDTVTKIVAKCSSPTEKVVYQADFPFPYLITEFIELVIPKNGLIFSIG